MDGEPDASETNQGVVRARSKRCDGRCQFVASTFILDILVELRSLFLSGRTGDDVQPAQSDDSPESGPDRFSPIDFGDRTSTGAGDGDVGALGQ